MKIQDLAKSALQSLERTRARSLLTMTGIVIGIMSVIMVLSIGEAAQRFILAQISAFGSDIIFLQNGADAEEGQPELFVKQSLTRNDVRRLQQQSWTTLITGILMQQDQLTANGLDTNVQLIGTMADEIRMNDLRVAQGAFFGQSSVDGAAREAVLGHEIADKAFGAEDPIGKSVRINGQSFRVVGVMAQAGTKAFQNVDKQVYVPVTTAMELYNRKYLTYITLRTSLPIADAKDRVRVLMRDYHNIDNPNDDRTKDDFHLQTQEDLIRSVTQITDILKILLISIAAISLLVGGIGIMNIMYVAVTERIKEIGLRKSIGARQADILGQFLIEAVMQTVLGGVIGTVLGIALSWVGIRIISSFQTGWAFGISWSGVALGICVSAAIGIVFGYFPARKAAALHPIEALRKE